MPVVARSLSVLDAFGDGVPSLRLSAIAARTGLPAPTTLRLVRELVAWGGLERQADGSYRLGTRLWVLGNRAPCPQRLRDAVGLPILHAATGHSAHVAVADTAGALVIGESGGLVPDGTLLPWHATAAGLVLLAWADDDVRASALAAPARLTPYTVTAPGLLTERLRRIRHGEVAVSREEWRPGRTHVAVAVPGPHGRPAGALALAGRTAIPPGAVAALRRTAAAAGAVLARH
ncbi:IclR family transcriptional regulator [Phytomonospora endophytica]|uniref:DNA-binding IclR family transcriptional regulator n=1 Tax=Phytomonospora endophytica TaxID=714109 RepID=A0A841FWM1_9ACTN|nr:IclR family transcriptional regulator C-terminal domain-containing protein [Phytomonospora endophytica]MBB6038128.1 DNA-binding IclR family transcriptional regulator [Phytomonospora endophytica]GIG67409.1 hypothetical protein Pen01_37040 [Phytomonospora endophytica]